MKDRQGFGMELEPLRWEVCSILAGAIEGIAQNRRIQPLGMGGMNPQLVGASGMGNELNTGDALIVSQYFKVGLAALALVPIHPLPRGMLGVGAKGEVKPAASLGEASL
jgi:hypothetical protein